MNFDEIMEQIKNPVDVTDQYDPGDIEANKLWAIIACIPPLFFVPLITCKDSGYGKFYANQGLLLTIVSLATGLVSGILNIIPLIGGLLSSLVSLVLGLAMIGMFILMMISIGQNKVRYLPLIGQMIEVFK